MSLSKSAIKDRSEVSSLDYFLSQKDEHYWSFRGRAKRDHCHSLINYPAMMVPQMQGELIDFFLEQDKNIKSVFDPFVGSGTVLVESMTRGLDFLGIDINPLAIMACETKAGPFFLNALNQKWESLKEKINSDTFGRVDYTFDEADKWFLLDVQVELCKIRRNIKKIKPKWARRFFWVAFSDVVRMTCNSRPTTYKLHIKDE
ncbi:MAG: hypothetical protein KDI92_16105, partial [Xanthomonadales bacterium]|nr:hypothetical protein [Xanthomonadales bacterium]